MISGLLGLETDTVCFLLPFEVAHRQTRYRSPIRTSSRSRSGV